MTNVKSHADACLEKHGLHPLDEPTGGDHHTDAPITDEDREVGELAYYLGGLFIDKQMIDPATPHGETYYYKEMSSLDIWTRVARALRVHGLKIVDGQ